MCLPVSLCGRGRGRGRGGGFHTLEASNELVLDAKGDPNLVLRALLVVKTEDREMDRDRERDR